MKRINMILLLGMFAISSVSCGSVNIEPKTATPENSKLWQLTWLDQAICKPPCWQNITPGLTTRDEVLSILENMPEVKITYSTKDELGWDFDTSTEGGIIRFSESGLVVFVWLTSTNEDLQLEKVVAVYGFPEIAQPFDCRNGMCDTALIYPDQGMLLLVFVDNEKEANVVPQIEILPETIVYRVYFTEPSIENTQNFLRSENTLLILDMEWKGFGEYP